MSDDARRIALYARVSTDKQAQSHTIDSQVNAIKERIVQEGLKLDAELCFCDDGVSGETLERPALERLRDEAAAGTIDARPPEGPAVAGPHGGKAAISGLCGSLADRAYTAGSGGGILLLLEFAGE